MRPRTLKIPAPVRTAGIIRTAWSPQKYRTGFYGARMTGLPRAAEAPQKIPARRIRHITNNIFFHNRVSLNVSLSYALGARGYAAARLYAKAPDVGAFARELIDSALKRELDAELNVMARGENVAANQRRQRIMGKYLTSKPYHIIKNFYGVRMQSLAASPPAGMREQSDSFYSDIIHERTSKTVARTTETKLELSPTAALPAATITDGDLNRIAAQAALKVEKRLRSERERAGKW